jgi:RNA polymerase sigma factor (sigma-70 family)
MSDPTEPADGGLYRDWNVLHRIDQDLQRLAGEYGLPLEDATDVRSSQRRAKQVEEIMRENGRRPAPIPISWQVPVSDGRLLRRRRRAPIPISWQELAERLFADRWLAGYVQSLGWYQAAPRDDTREEILRCVQARLYFVVVRNSGDWYRKGNHAQDWKGYVNVRQIAKRRARDAGSHHGGWGCGGDGPDGPFGSLPDWRELSPEQQAELREQIDRLPEDEREVLRRWFYEEKSPQDIAAELNVTPQELRVRVERALGRLGDVLSARQRRGKNKK